MTKRTHFPVRFFSYYCSWKVFVAKDPNRLVLLISHNSHISRYTRNRVWKYSWTESNASHHVSACINSWSQWWFKNSTPPPPPHWSSLRILCHFLEYQWRCGYNGVDKLEPLAAAVRHGRVVTAHALNRNPFFSPLAVVNLSVIFKWWLQWWKCL